MKSLRIVIISNIFLEPYFSSSLKKYFSNGEVVFMLHNEITNDLLNNLDFIVVWLNFERLFPDEDHQIFSGERSENDILHEVLCIFENIYKKISGVRSNHILWFLLEDYYKQIFYVRGAFYDGLIDKINITIKEKFSSNTTNFIDLKHLIAKIGINNTYNSKNKYRWNAPYTKVLINESIQEIHKYYLVNRGFTKKCLVIDCDNVLWGGILSEDGVGNIKLNDDGFGRPFKDFQRFLLSLYYHGVILAVCSKNNLSDVLMVFDNHNEMILKKEHIACYQVNWNNKPDNIKEIAITLNIGLESIVFIDDSAIEVEAVKVFLPEVTTVIYNYSTIYNDLACFNLKQQNSINFIDIKNRITTYQTNQSRRNLKSKYENYDEYINALEVNVEIHNTLPIECSRIAELSQRTNRCTNGARYTEKDIKNHIANSDIDLYSVFVSDRFSHLGLVGSFEIQNNTLMLFNLSCRALGRKIENFMLEFIINKYSISNIYFKPTGKNDDLQILLIQNLSNIKFI